MNWNIFGHDWAIEMLQLHIQHKKMRHAYLFSGPAGVGRRTLALRFAQAVNCEEPVAPGVPCMRGRSCQQIMRMQHPDLAVVQADESGILKVEQVRELQHFVSLAPYASNYRIVLLVNFEQANHNAQNALLKTLEEPNPRVLLLVTVDDAENLLPTIKSRCELIRLRSTNRDALAAFLLREKDISQADTELIAALSGGRVGIADHMIENEEVLTVRETWMEDLLQLIQSGISERIAFSRKRSKGKYIERTEAKQKLLTGLPYWLSFWRDVMLIKSGSTSPITNIDMRERIAEISLDISLAEVESVISGIEHAFGRMRSANLQLLLDNLLLSFPLVQLNH